MESIIRFKHGSEICSVAPGEFCRFSGSKRFGQEPTCLLFHVDLEIIKEGLFRGWVQRCKSCFAEFG